MNTTTIISVSITAALTIVSIVLISIYRVGEGVDNTALIGSIIAFATVVITGLFALLRNKE